MSTFQFDFSKEVKPATGTIVRDSIKKGLNTEDTRNKRLTEAISLRKKNRNETVKRQRNVSLADKQQQNADPEINQLIDRLIRDNGTFPESLIQAIHNNQDLPLLGKAINLIRRLLNNESTLIVQKIIDANLVPRLIQCMTQCTQDPKIQKNAANCLANLCNGTPEQTSTLITLDIIPAMLSMLKVQNTIDDYDMWDNVIWALANICGENGDTRNAVLQQGGLNAILLFCTLQTPFKLLRTATWCLSNMVRTRPRRSFSEMYHMLPILENLLSTTDLEVLQYVCMSLNCVLQIDNSNDNSELDFVCTRHSTLIQKMLLILDKSNDIKDTDIRRIVQDNLVQGCGHIAVGGESHCAMLIENRLIYIYMKLLEITDFAVVRSYICWTFSNIAGTGEAQVNSLLSVNGFLKKIIDVTCSDSFQVFKEAIWILTNFIDVGNDQHLKYFVDNGILTALCEALRRQHNEYILPSTLRAIDKLLRFGKRQSITNNEPCNKYTDYIEELGGLTTLEELQTHEHNQISLLAISILTDYWDPVEQIVPNTNQNSISNIFQQEPNNAVNVNNGGNNAVNNNVNNFNQGSNNSVNNNVSNNVNNSNNTGGFNFNNAAFGFQFGSNVNNNNPFTF